MRPLLPLLVTTASLLAVPISGSVAADVPKVAASIKPIHSLVSAVMEGVGEPTLIVDGAGSPHTYSMKPSNAADLDAADIVFWAGDGLEAFLVKPLETLGADARAVALIDAPGLERLAYREGGAFEAHRDADEGEVGHDHAGSEGAADAVHDHDGEAGNPAHTHEADAAVHAAEDHEEHAHGAYDMHFWLDPQNAKAMVGEIAKTLASTDPANAATYAANASRVDARLDSLIAKTTTDLANVKDKPFVVFHDAYQYYEHRFGVAAAGSITVSPETIPGVRRIAEIQAKVKALGATCVFAEPQFEPKLVSVVTEGTQAHTGVLDPEGAALPNGPDLYFQLIEGLTTSLKDCLSQQS